MQRPENPFQGGLAEKGGDSEINEMTYTNTHPLDFTGHRKLLKTETWVLG